MFDLNQRNLKARAQSGPSHGFVMGLAPTSKVLGRFWVGVRGWIFGKSAYIRRYILKFWAQKSPHVAG